MTHTPKKTQGSKRSHRNPAAEGARGARLDNRFNKAMHKITTWSNAMAADRRFDPDHMDLIVRLEALADDLGADGACLRCGMINSKTRLATVEGATTIIHARVRCSCSALYRSVDAKTALTYGHR